MRPWLGGVLGALAIAQPLSAQESPLPPPYEGVYQPQGVDEIGFWREDDESERALAASPLVIRDAALNSYVKGVLCETVGQDRCNAVRVYILREPTFNASMSPNGTMRVFSGLFLRVRSEAELGAVLGHEFGHFERRHSLAGFRRARSGTDLLAWTSLLVSMAPSYGAASSQRSLEMAVYGQIFRHGRDQEREADRLGVSYLNQGRLRPQAASEVWKTVMTEAESSARSRGLKKPNFKAIAFFASHPPEAERADNLAALAVPDGAARDDGSLRYREALAPFMPQFLDDQIKLNDFGASDFLIENMAESGGWSAPLWFSRGELYRLRGAQRDFVNAADFYARAIALDPSLAEAHRGLGLALFKTGRREEGMTALKEYLNLKPDASDAKMIALMLPQDTGS